MDADILNQINNIDLSTVETEYPLLKSGMVSVQVQTCEWQTETSKKTGKDNTYLNLKVVTTQPWETVAHEGRAVRTISPGFPITHRIYVGSYVDDKDGSPKQYGVTQVAQLREAAFGKAQSGARFNAPEMLGQNIVVVLKFEPNPKDKDGNTFGPRTSIDRFVAKRT